MLKSVFVSLTLVAGITAATTEYAFTAPRSCDTSVSFQSCLQPGTTALDCTSSSPCSCSGEDLLRKCWLSYCPAVTYTSTFWMTECTSQGFPYIDADGYYITNSASYLKEPKTVSATATATAASQTDNSSAATSKESSQSSEASAGAGSPTSGASPTSATDASTSASSATAAANASSSTTPNDAGHAMGFPTGGVLAILATAAGAIAGMLLL